MAAQTGFTNLTDDEIIAVVQAHKEGKRIQRQLNPPLTRQIGADKWEEISWHSMITDGRPEGFDFRTYTYRVAPEPRKPREWLLCDGTGHDRWIVVPDDHISLEACEGERVHVREVIE